MGLNVTNIFIIQALDALRDNMHHLEYEEKEDLCDTLIKLCDKYAPGTFKDSGEGEKPEDINGLECEDELDDGLDELGDFSF